MEDWQNEVEYQINTPILFDFPVSSVLTQTAAWCRPRSGYVWIPDVGWIWADTILPSGECHINAIFI